MYNNTYDEGGNLLRIAHLSDRGVTVWGAQVYIDADVPLDNINPSAELQEGRISGSTTRIGAGSKIGVSGPARVTDCQIGRNVELGAGTFEGATLLDGAKVRGFAELRPGTLLEEQTEAAHSVAFKNTILTAGAVAGSVLNFCDAFLSGGTSRSDHSEIGSGAVHFNFDPRGDKWGSLFGDARGVLMRSAPVFIGGQCGLVGPLHVDFGAVLAAGSVVRRDVPADCVHSEAGEAGQTPGFDREIYTSLTRKLQTTAKLIGTLTAFDAWYELVRIPFADSEQIPLYRAAQRQARLHTAERMKRLEKLIAKLPRSIAKVERSGDARLQALLPQHLLLIEQETAIREALTAQPEDDDGPPMFLTEYAEARKDADHLGAVAGVSDVAAHEAAAWLSRIAAAPVARLQRVLHTA